MSTDAASQRKPHQRNPRRAVLDKLRQVKRTVDAMVSQWQFVPSTDLYRNAEGNLGYWGHRGRANIPASEYIENDPKYWAQLYNLMAEAEAGARDIKLFAHSMYRATGGVIHHG